MLPYSLAQMPANGNCPPSILAMDRLRFAASGLAAAQMGHPYFPPYGTHGLSDHPLAPYRGFDPRTRFIQEEPKPQHSYIGLIAMAILSSPDKKLVLSDIYQWILDNYPYFRTRGPGWRNSIRHNLSLNDCFIKAGRSANGKGHYWAIHPANIEDFKKCDFRRRRAQRKARKAMGYQVPDEEDDEDSPCGSPTGVPIPVPEPVAGAIHPERGPFGSLHHHLAPGILLPGTQHTMMSPGAPIPSSALQRAATPKANGGPLVGGTETSAVMSGAPPTAARTASRKRQFDMESLLAPEPKPHEREPADKGPKQHPQTATELVNHMIPNAFQFANPFFMPGNPFLNWQIPTAAPGSTSAGPQPPAGLDLSSPNSGGTQTPSGHVIHTSTGSPTLNQQSSDVKPPVTPNSMMNRGPSPASPTSAQKWQETFAKIMARSYQARSGLRFDVPGIPIPEMTVQHGSGSPLQRDGNTDGATTE